MSATDRIRHLGRDKVRMGNTMASKFAMRPYLSEEFLKKWLFEFDKLKFESELQENGTYQLIYEISKRYHLVIFVAVDGTITVVTAFHSSKALEKLIKGSGVYWYVKKV